MKISPWFGVGLFVFGVPLVVTGLDAMTGVVSDFIDPRNLAHPFGSLFAGVWTLMVSASIAAGSLVAKRSVPIRTR